MQLRQWKITEQHPFQDARTSYWIGDTSLPFPFTGLEQIVLQSRLTKLTIITESGTYKLEDAHVDVAPQYAFGTQQVEGAGLSGNNYAR